MDEQKIEAQEKQAAKPAANKSVKQMEEMYPVEVLIEKHNLPAWIFAGLKAAQGWGSGKELTEEEFLRLRDGWLSGPLRREK